jgi:cytochrome c nitrite reductase small subunit
VKVAALGLAGVSVPGLILCACLGIAVGAGSYTLHYGQAFSYFSSDPKICANCHIMRDYYDSWARSSHHAVATCNDCHAPHDLVGKYVTKAENGFWHSKAFTFQDFHDPLIIRPRNSRVLQESCIYCHRELVADVLGHGQVTDGGAMACARCHGGVGHGPAK